MKQDSSDNHPRLAYLRHELCTPINSTISYSELLLSQLQDRPFSTLSEDLQKVRDCGHQLLTRLQAVLDGNRRLLSQPEGDWNGFAATLRMELISPLSAAIGYCEMLLEEAPAELIPEVEKLNGSARQILSAINDVVHWAQAQVQTVSIESEELVEFEALIEAEEPIESEEPVEPEDFSFITLDTIEFTLESSQPTRAFPLATQDAHVREQSLEPRWQNLFESESPLLQVSEIDRQPREIAAREVKPNHLEQLQGRDKESLDVESLHRPSLYPPLSRQSYLEGNRATFTSRTTITSKIVTVHSFRGGTGKSNIASSLAISLAKQGKRVGIVDTDLLSPGMHVLFGLQNKALGRTLNDYLRGDCLLHEAALDMSHCLSQNSMQRAGAIYLVPASPKPSDIMRVAKERYEKESLTDGFRELIDYLDLDFLLIDTRSGVSEETLQAIAVCSLLLVVLRPDYQDYQGTSVVLELARKLSVKEMSLVVNKVLPTFDIDAYCEQLEATYEVPVSRILPFYEDIVQLASSEVFSLRYPHHPLAEAIDAIAQNIADSANLSSTDEDMVVSAMTLH